MASVGRPRTPTAHQVIVACSLSAQPSDAVVFLPLVSHIGVNLGRRPEKVSADSGLLSAANLAPKLGASTPVFLRSGGVRTPWDEGMREKRKTEGPAPKSTDSVQASWNRRTLCSHCFELD